jgi:hypothetical protein
VYRTHLNLALQLPLPAELILKILNDLPLDYSTDGYWSYKPKKTLAILCRVSRAFYPLARQTLFSYVEHLHVTKADSPVPTLLDIREPLPSGMRDPLFPALEDAELLSFIPISTRTCPALRHLTFKQLPTSFDKSKAPTPPRLKSLDVHQFSLADSTPPSQQPVSTLNHKTDESPFWWLLSRSKKSLLDLEYPGGEIEPDLKDFAKLTSIKIRLSTAGTTDHGLPNAPNLDTVTLPYCSAERLAELATLPTLTTLQIEEETPLPAAAFLVHLNDLDWLPKLKSLVIVYADTGRPPYPNEEYYDHQTSTGEWSVKMRNELYAAAERRGLSLSLRANFTRKWVLRGQDAMTSEEEEGGE